MKFNHTMRNPLKNFKDIHNWNDRQKRIKFVQKLNELEMKLNYLAKFKKKSKIHHSQKFRKHNPRLHQSRGSIKFVHKESLGNKPRSLFSRAVCSNDSKQNVKRQIFAKTQLMPRNERSRLAIKGRTFRSIKEQREKERGRERERERVLQIFTDERDKRRGKQWNSYRKGTRSFGERQIFTQSRELLTREHTCSLCVYVVCVCVCVRVKGAHESELNWNDVGNGGRKRREQRFHDRTNTWIEAN